MVNKTVIAARRAPFKNPNLLKYYIFLTWHGFRLMIGEPRLGRAWRFAGSRQPWERRTAVHQGRTTDGERTPHRTIAASRRLSGRLDVVANNVANVNTNGFKADKSLFEEYLMPGAHEDNFVGRDRRVSYVQDRATYHDFARARPSRPATRWTSPSTATASSWCRPRAANATPATAPCRSMRPGPARHRRRQSGAGHQRPDRRCSRPTTTSHLQRRHRDGARRQQHADRLHSRQAAAGRGSRNRRSC